MTNEQINIAIAEACGWLNCILPSQDEYHLMTDLELGRAMGRPVGRNFSLHKDGSHYPLPNFCNDLNAMREAMLTLTNKQGFGFLWHLNDMGFVGGDWELLTLDSQVLAEAFLRTFGKWEE
jgi:hypothetical protein